MKTALFWETLASGKIQCGLCPHHCVLGEGQAGLCGVRRAVGGALIAAGYGRVSAEHLDPIEKKPLYHFYPGRWIYSVGGWGCNFACRFCQNWTLSQQVREDGPRQEVADIVRAAGRQRSIGVAFTYNEPTINAEFILDCAPEIRRHGLANVLVTNGFMEERPAAQLLPLLAALNIDIKSMDEAFYRTHCRGALAPVLRFCRQAVAAGCHVEITNLVIPGLNDADDQIARLAEWVADQLGPLTPLHLSAYHPDFQMDRPPTPLDTLARAAVRCRRVLSYVYVGNVAGDAGHDTVCPQCGADLIVRRGYATQVVGVTHGRCARCGRAADVIGAA